MDKKQPVIFGGVVWRSFRQPYAQQRPRSIQPGPLLPALKGAPINVVHHSKIGTQHTKTEVMNHIQVLLNLTGRSEHSCSQCNECVTAMMKIPPGEIMCLVHIADLFDKAPATKGIEAWKYCLYNPYWGYNHVPNIALSVDGLSASQLMTICRDGA
jgi:hypothetical protein